MEETGDEVLDSVRHQIRQLTTIEHRNIARKKQQWKEDAEVLKAYVSALSATRAVLRQEQNAVSAKIHQTTKKTKVRKSRGGSLQELYILSKSEVQIRLETFRHRVKEAEHRVEQAAQSLSGAVKLEERTMLEDQISIMKETRKLCLDEARLLEVMLQEMEAVEEKRKALMADWEELERLKEQLKKLDAKIDNAKRSLLFPAVHGFKFRVGSSGVYVGAKDLYVSDLSAGFSLSVESVNPDRQTAEIRMHMTGRERRPSPIAIPGNDSAVGSVDVLVSTDANAMNNHLPPSPNLQTDYIDPSTEKERQQSYTTQQGAVDETRSHEQARAEIGESDFMEQSTTALLTDMSETESDPSTKNLVETTEIQSAPGSLPSKIEQPLTQEDLAMTEITARGGNSPKKSFATKVFTKIAEKTHVPRSVAKASHVLFFTPPPKPLRKDRHPSFSQSLFKKFILADELAKRDGEGTAKYRSNPTNPHHKPPSKAQPLEPDSVSLSSPVDLEDVSTDPPSPSKRNVEFMSRPSRHGESNGMVSEDSESTLDVEPRRKSMFRWSETTPSEGQSETTSLVGAGRRGVYVKLQGTHVNVVGEKGTRVPNITVKDMTLEVECRLSVVFEFSFEEGWQSRDGLKLEVIQLRKKAIGNSIPLPAGLVKTLLNLILPKIVEKALANALPKELGKYVLTSRKGCAAAGEVTIVGPPLSATHVALNTPSPFLQSRSQSAAVKAYAAVQEAQSLLSLTTDQAALLGYCFAKGKHGLIHEADPGNGICSINELCGYYNTYHQTEVWLAMCDLWNKAIRHVARQRGLACGLDFRALMHGAVARLSAKPVRTECRLTRLNCKVNIDAALTAFRDYYDRTARELYAEKPLSASTPLDQQLKGLQKWYAETKTKIAWFKSTFKSFMTSIVARADARSLQIDLERAQYEGPLHFELPIVHEIQDPEVLSFDVSIPAPGDSSSTQFFDSISRALHAIHALKTAETVPTPGTESQLQWGISSSIIQKLDTILNGSDCEDASTSTFTESLSLGKAFIQRLQTSITLNEDYIAQTLLDSGAISNADALKAALNGLGPVVAGEISPASDNSSVPYRLKFRSSDHARFKCLLETAGFQSTVSPAEVFSMFYICVREYLRTFQTDDVIRSKTVEDLLKQVIRYVDKRSLDIIFCSQLESRMEDGAWMVSLREPDATGTAIRHPIQIVNDLDITLLMDSLSFAQGQLET